MPPPPPALASLLDSRSREVRLTVDRDGVVTWSDAPARAMGLDVGRSLVDAAVPGCEERARALVAEAAAAPGARCELSFVVAGRAETLLVCADPYDGGAALLGSRVPQDYADAVADVTRTMAEIVDLSRRLARQKNQLEESNRAIRALHAELAQHADNLRASVEVRSRIVAAVSHEFRTPLHSILGLSRLLLSGSDGEINPEQRTQVQFIRQSAEELSHLVNDMLDLAKLDAGTATIRAERFELEEFLTALRGTTRPLLAEGAPVRLVFEPAPAVELETDRAKLAQIARNLVANAVKYTERGEIRVRARAVEGDRVCVEVADTGVGIAREHHAQVFEEFVQIESALQRSVQGTGLGLPLSRKLAAILGGDLTMTSELGVGSTFTVTFPRVHPDVGAFQKLVDAARTVDPGRSQVLVVEDDRTAVFAYERYLSMAGFQVVPTRSTAEARRVLESLRPAAILLDIMLEGEDTWTFLADVKRDPRTRDVPVLVCTVTNREQRARALGADEFWLKPVDEDKLLRKLSQLSTPRGARVLVIDDDPAARYLIERFLADTPFVLLQAAAGAEGIRLARTERPHVILLDFLLDNMTAFDVLDELKGDPLTRQIPVIIVTSHALPAEDRVRLSAHAEAILSKESLSRELAIHRIRDALRKAGVRSTQEVR